MANAGSGHQVEVPAPIFVLCVARSCSTVAVAMLGCHPGAYAFPELLLFTGSTVREIAELRSSSMLEQMLRSGLPRAVAELWFGSQSSDAIKEARRWIQDRNDQSPERLFAELLEKVAPRVGIEKSPDTAFSEDRLASCLRSFPNARFIHLVRHPVSNVRSLARHLGQMRAYQQGKDETEMDIPEIARSAAQTWIDTHRRILHCTAGLAERQVLVLTAEELLTNPRSAIPPVLKWAGLDASADVVERMCHPERWSYARLGPPEAEAGGDIGFLENPELASQPAPESFLPPAAWRLEDSMSAELDDLATELGYTTTTAD